MIRPRPRRCSPISRPPRRPASDLDHYRRGAPDSDDLMVELMSIFGREEGEPLPDFSVFPPEIMEFESPPGTYVDAYPVLVTQIASLAALNAAIGAPGTAPTEAPLPMTRFRPNIVLAGLTPFDEDHIDRLRVRDVVLRLAKPSTRCIVTTTDQETGTRGVEPLPALRKLRWNRKLQGVTFGENATVLQPGALRVGDTVEVTYRR